MASMTADDRKAVASDFLTRVYGDEIGPKNLLWVGNGVNGNFTGSFLDSASKAATAGITRNTLRPPAAPTEDDITAYADLHGPDDLDAITAAIIAQKRDQARENSASVYFRQTTMPYALRDGGRGRNEQSARAYILALDMDINRGVHADLAKYPDTFEQCKAILDHAGLPAPTLWVCSGGGYYPIWQFERSIDLTATSTREAVATNYRRVTHSAWLAGYELGGWDMDNTSDLSRIIRLPGTQNRKHSDHTRWTECRVVDGEGSGERVIPAELFAATGRSADELLAAYKAGKAERKGREKANTPKPAPVPRATTPKPASAGASKVWTGNESDARREIARFASTEFAESVTNNGINHVAFRAGRFVPEILDLEVAEELVREAIAEHGETPATEQDARTLRSGIEAGMSYQPRPELSEAGWMPPSRAGQRETFPPFQPARVAEQFTTAEAANWTFYNDDFYAWTGTHYQAMTERAAKKTLHTALKDAFWIDRSGDEPKRKDWNPNTRNLHEVYEALAMEKLSDTPPESATALTNGVYDLTSRTLLPHDPARFNVTSLPFAYDPNAECPEFLKFLKSSLPDDPASHDLLQEWLGYLLSGRTDQHKMLVLQGKPRSGKGTIGRLVKALIGPDATAAPMLDDLGTQFGKESLINKSLALMADVVWNTRNAPAAMSFLLLATGGDPVDIQRKNRRAWSGQLSARFMAMTNREIQFKDPSGALASRFMIVKFTVSFLGREDRGLDARLHAELPGIFNWALKGLDRLTENGRFTEPQATKDANEEIRLGGSPLVEWLESEHVTHDPAALTPLAEVFDQYQLWARSNRILVAESSIVFSRDLVAVDDKYTSVRKTADGVKKRFLPIRIVKPLQQPFVIGNDGWPNSI